MEIAILSNTGDLSSYVTEIFSTWGLSNTQTMPSGNIDGLDPVAFPVLVVPDAGDRPEAAIVRYAVSGGTAIVIKPRDTLASSAGLTTLGVKDTPLRLRVTAFPVSGLAGELLPIVGSAVRYECEEHARPLAYLSHPGQFDGESVGITETGIGSGRLICFAFDLALCVLLLRQGDPERAEIIPEGDACARPSHMASAIGPHDAGWIPFADLLSRLLVDLCRRFMPCPLPIVSHLPASAPGILLYSGDEDNAEVASNDEEFACVTEYGGKMNLYIIPGQTKSTPEDAVRYSTNHHIGPHPNLRPLDGHPVQERLAEFERQIKLFESTYSTSAVSVRNHCTAWAGYLEPVEVMERLGIRMDANYFSGTYKSDREGAPYAAFGGALPSRFCLPDGRLYDVYQQHTHLTDDGMFGPPDYSFKISPEVFRVNLNRIFSDISARFHTPYGVCIHPGNWVKFSGEQGKELMLQANQFGLPIWSFDQWVHFWDARDTWRIDSLRWEAPCLRFTVQGDNHPDLRLQLPEQFENLSLVDFSVDGVSSIGTSCSRYGDPVSLYSMPLQNGVKEICVRYGG